jgi:GNAT superfamily N-acetyltransferase
MGRVRTSNRGAAARNALAVDHVDADYGSMDVRFTGDIEEYATRVTPYLEQDPVRCTVSLSVIETYRAEPLPDAALFSWVEADGAVVATASVTPPYALLLSPMSVDAAVLIGRAWAERRADLPGVVGIPDAAAACAEVIATRHDRRVRTKFAERLFRLDAVIDPPAPPGRPRPAQPADHATATEWVSAFVDETGVTRDGNIAHNVDVRIKEGRLTLWDHDGATVSLAGTAPTVRGVTRIGPVYTPPALRGRGYARALVAEVSRNRLDDGSTACCLFTDLANPVSNAIYQQVGYRPVGDFAELVFD